MEVKYKTHVFYEPVLVGGTWVIHSWMLPDTWKFIHSILLPDALRKDCLAGR
jgi:hypothetical protein